MKLLHFVFLYLAITISFSYLSAQTRNAIFTKNKQVKRPLSFEHFTSENGLSENFVYSIYQDKKGFLWIGTHDGLNRYDGYSFKKIRHSPFDKNSLPDNTIYSIAEDGQGHIWLGTNAGLCQFNPSTGIAKTIILQNKLKTVEQVISISEEELLIKQERKLCLFNTRTQKEASLNYKDSTGLHPLLYSLSPISKDIKGNIYIIKQGTGNAQIFKYDRSNKWFAPFITLPVPDKYSKFYGGLVFYYDSRDQFWLTVGEEETLLFRRSIDSRITTVQIFLTKAVRQIFEDDERNMWLACNTGLMYHDRYRNLTHWYKQNIANTASITSNDIQGIIQDATGLIWIATSTGLNKLNPAHKKIGHLEINVNVHEGLYKNFVMGLYSEGQDHLRIHYSTPKNRYFTRYQLSNQNFRHFAYSHYNSTDYIKDIAVKNPEKLTIPLLQVAVDFYKNHGTSFFENLAGSIWIDRIQQLWSDDGSILTSLNTGEKRLRDTNIVFTDLYDDDLWMATTKGLVQFNTVTKKRVVHNTVSNGNYSISANDITCFLFVNDGNMWVATKGGGLNFFEKRKKTFRHFTEKDGLCNNSIYCMVMDDKGRLWLGTTFGLSVFNPVTKKFKNFFRADGLINNEYNRKSACKMPDGTLFMGGMNGVDYFHPDSLLKTERTPAVQITDIKLFNQSIYHRNLSSLRHDQNFITIEFAALHFTNPAANKFAYKLEKADNDWVISEGRNFATYSHLQPGNYRFLVKAANSNGIWNEMPATLQFTISSAWYRTWWFYGLCVLVVAAFAYSLFRIRLLQKLRVLQIRNRLHRDLHDDVGATLSSVKVYSEILGKNGNNEVISGLIKDNATEMMDRLEVISWATNPVYDNFKSLVDAMLKFARPLTHANDIELKFEKTGFDNELMIPGDIRQNILLIFKEAMNNMLKYAGATECDVRLVIIKQRMMLEITDNGKGADGTIKGGGAGLKNMHKRAEEMNGTLLTESSTSGTLVRLTLPYPFKIPNTWYKKKL